MGHLLGHGNTLIIATQPDIMMFRKLKSLLLYFLFKRVLDYVVYNSCYSYHYFTDEEPEH